MGTAIITSQLSKDYGQGRGLNDLSLTVTEGEIFGFLGPNGAGKTTTIRLLMGLIRPTHGTATLFGHDCWTDAVALKHMVGYIPGDLPAFGGMRGHDVINYVAGMRRDADLSFATSLAERFELDLRMRYREYSRGNKQKLAIVLAFMHHPRLLILDEPTGGLDPLNQMEFRKLVHEVIAKGATIFLSSHILAEVEETCDHIGIIRNGSLVQVTELDTLRSMQRKAVTITFEHEVPVKQLAGIASINDLVTTETSATFTISGAFGPLIDALNGAHVREFTSHEPTLEEIFLSLYGTK